MFRLRRQQWNARNPQSTEITIITSVIKWLNSSIRRRHGHGELSKLHTYTHQDFLYKLCTCIATYQNFNVNYATIRLSQKRGISWPNRKCVSQPYNASSVKSEVDSWIHFRLWIPYLTYTIIDICLDIFTSNVFIRYFSSKFPAESKRYKFQTRIIDIRCTCHVNSEHQGKVMSSALSPVVSSSGRVLARCATPGGKGTRHSRWSKAKRDVASELLFYDFPVG